MTPETLKAARAYTGTSQEALARALDVATITIRSWESGRTAINAAMADRIRVELAPYFATEPAHYTLHRLPDGAGVVTWRNSAYHVIGGQAGFAAADVAEAEAMWGAGEDVSLDEWWHLEITPEAATYVAATYPVVGNT